MDNMRGHFPDHEDAQDDGPDFDSAEDELGREPPPAAIGQDERRMQVRAYNFWASLLDNRNFPPIEDSRPEALPDFGPYSVLLDFTGGIENPAITYPGRQARRGMRRATRSRRLSDVPSRSLLSRITDHYMQILANQAPIGFEAEFVNQRGARSSIAASCCRSRVTTTTIDFIYGVINWKELADQKTTDELLLEIDQALESTRFAARESLPMTEWADGPVEQIAPLELDTPLDDGEFGYPEPELSSGPEYASLLGRSTLDGPAIDDGLAQVDSSSLADLLAAARDHADEAASSEKRTHQALYAAIGTAHDFALAAKANPADYLALLDDSGLVAQERAPMVPVVKLVFGLGYDKTRVAEYAAVLDHARRLDLGAGELASLLDRTAGGLKALVAEERRLRKLDSGKQAGTARQEKLIARLRAMPAHSIADIPTSGSEFTLLFARRTDGGRIEILGELDDEPALIEKAARLLVR
jgi:hypothetical protein